MNEVQLFSYLNADREQSCLTDGQLATALREIKADDCELLFIHTDLAAIGQPNPKLKRREFLQRIYEVLLELHVKTLVFPAFTFSFPNGEAFNVNTSTAKYMGSLNEYVRKQKNAVRSLDPLMSVVAVGERAENFYKVGKQCMGEGGIFSMIHAIPNVRFLFLGAAATNCFTHAHYVEACHKVPYRFEKWYSGIVTDRDGNSYEDKFSVYAACKNIIPAAMTPLETHLKQKGAWHSVAFGSARLVCFKETDAYQAVWDALDENIHGFLAHPFTAEDLVQEVKVHDERILMVP